MGVVFVAIGLTVADEGPCFSHVTDNCDTVSGWSTGSCNSVYGGFRGNSNNLHRIIVDDFTDSMTYLLMASHFNTDVVNRAGFSKLFMGHSDEMKALGTSLDLMKVRASDVFTAYKHSLSATH